MTTANLDDVLGRNTVTVVDGGAVREVNVSGSRKVCLDPPLYRRQEEGVEYVPELIPPQNILRCSTFPGLERGLLRYDPDLFSPSYLRYVNVMYLRRPKLFAGLLSSARREGLVIVDSRAGDDLPQRQVLYQFVAYRWGKNLRLLPEVREKRLECSSISDETVSAVIDKLLHPQIDVADRIYRQRSRQSG